VYPAQPIDRTIVTLKGYRFISLSEKLADLFGFDNTEMRSMRVLFGPATRLEAVQIGMEQCIQFNHHTSIPVILYNKKADSLCVALELSKAEDQAGCVLLHCVLLPHIPMPPPPDLKAPIEDILLPVAANVKKQEDLFLAEAITAFQSLKT
jgi:hypothetical protein